MKPLDAQVSSPSPFRRRRFDASHRRRSLLLMLARPFLTALLLVGLPVKDIAIDGDCPGTECLHIHSCTKAASDKPLDFGGAAVRFSAFPPLAGRRASGQHIVFRCDPAGHFVLHPRGLGIIDASGTQNGGGVS